ncbi:MAG: DNA recombination protein RmuC [Puniceicoccales bacterium]|jgi:DNA recombination protein RmuC|nr:DNA recombination protein RmuC [Puniceicoccales bacterium]
MIEFQILTFLCTLGVLALVIWQVNRRPAPLDFSSLERKNLQLSEELHRLEQNLRAEISQGHAGLRTEITIRLDSIVQQQLVRLDQLREATMLSLAQSRAEIATTLSKSHEQAASSLSHTRVELNEAVARIRQTLDSRLENLAVQNAAKLDEMRATVDEKLQSTLEKRLGENFKLVGENLEKVVRSLGEMQQMAASVGDLKRVLTNVKTRGTWGEYQLENILSSILERSQYASNVAVVPDSQERVEFAIRLPGGRGVGEVPVWLPVDSKFPVEDYERLTLAAEQADAEAVATSLKALSERVLGEARTISQKYIAPPHTTDFAILFLPTEGLYAEVLRQPGLADKVQREHRVVLAGPTTISALLNSLQMGFRTLAIEQRASEVWKVLRAAKSEFSKFGDVLAKVQKKLEAASREIEDTGVRTRAINRTLRDVEALPENEAPTLQASIAASEPPQQTGDNSNFFIA